MSMCAAFCLLLCSNPTRETLKWRSAIDLPVSNTSFNLAEQFDDLFGAIKELEDFRMLGIDSFTVDSVSDTHPHCIAFSKTNRDTFSFQQRQDTIGNKTFEVVLGAIPLSSAGNISTRIAPGVTGAVAADVRQSLTGTVRLPKVRRIAFDSDPANCRLPVRITNSTGAIIDSLSVTLVNLLPSAPRQYIGRLIAGQSDSVVFSVEGNAIDSTLQIRIEGILKAGGTVAAGSGVDVSAALSKVKARSAIVMDSMLALADTFTNRYKITDSINIDYADIQDGFFNYTLDNGSGVDLYVSAEHHDLWITPACDRKNVTTVLGLSTFANASDSFNYYSGVIIDGDRHIEPRTNKRFARLNLSGNRMFPKWDDSTKNSVTRVDYIVRIDPRGSWDTINSTDRLVFTIQPTEMNYQQMAGTLVKDYEKMSDTQSVEVPFPWPGPNRDSLRGHFVLHRVQANMDLNMDLPDSAFLSALQVKFRVVAPAYPDSFLDTNVAFGIVKKDTLYRRTLNITRVVNNFPDSIKIVTHVKVPAGTRIRAINDVNHFEKSVGVMTVKAYVDYKLNAFFDWSVPRLTTMDLGADTFTIEEKGVRAFRRMSDRSFAFVVRVTNKSNANIALYALFAPDSLRTRLYVDSLTTNEVNALVLDNTGKAEQAGFINLLGSDGVYIPARDSVYYNYVVLKDQQLARILSTNKGSMRWMLQFMPSSRDSMTNRDDITINSYIHFEGVNNMDSVVTAFE